MHVLAVASPGEPPGGLGHGGEQEPRRLASEDAARARRQARVRRRGKQSELAPVRAVNARVSPGRDQRRRVILLPGVDGIDIGVIFNCTRDEREEVHERESQRERQLRRRHGERARRRRRRLGGEQNRRRGNRAGAHAHQDSPERASVGGGAEHQLARDPTERGHRAGETQRAATADRVNQLSANERARRGAGEEEMLELRRARFRDAGVGVCIGLYVVV
mmetsp:Transcript_10097/g.42974  ORF Transcript_10097/g.42974 Transcript_10097/m.42974 type:complete len:220 (-) Transcript_10097:507-1166(-)